MDALPPAHDESRTAAGEKYPPAASPHHVLRILICKPLTRREQHMEQIHMRPSTLPTAVAVAALVFGAVAATPTRAQMKEHTVTVGGAPMYPSKNIIQNAVNSKDHTTLVAAVKAAGLVETLQGPGPFTVFAPTNAAFAKLPTGTVDSLLKPQMKEKLSAVLTYHVVPGRLSAKDLWEAANKGGGKAKFKTVEGEELTVESNGQALTIRDAKGNASRVTIQNVFQSNGVIHVIDSVLMPS
jgi:uncharacterized surface protein with fasciclin (FAS1) repeats